MLDRLLEKLESKSLAEGVPDDDDDDDDESDRNDNDEEAVPDEDDDDDDEVDRNNNDEGSEEYEGKDSKSDKKLKHIKQFDSVATKEKEIMEQSTLNIFHPYREYSIKYIHGIGVFVLFG